MANLSDLLAGNKLVIKIVASLVGVGLLWANRKFNIGMTTDDIHAAAAIDAAFILGVALHKPNAPTPAAPASGDPGAVQKPGGQS